MSTPTRSAGGECRINVETVVKQALSAAGITFEAVVVDGDTTIIIGAKRKVPGNTTLSSSHGGFAGKSIIEKIRDDLDEAYSIWKERLSIDSQMHAKNPELDRQFTSGDLHCQQCFDALGDQYMAEGIAHALGLLRSSSADYEWEEAQKRYEASRG